jgi:chromodomain-containing protein
MKYSIQIVGKSKFKVNDIVRISKYKHLFCKGYTPNWTTELFKIIKIRKTDPVTYMLEDMNNRPIEGAFYEQELSKTQLPNVYLVQNILKTRKRKGKEEVYVSWVGFDSSHNCWIPKANVL